MYGFSFKRPNVLQKRKATSVLLNYTITRQVQCVRTAYFPVKTEGGSNAEQTQRSKQAAAVRSGKQNYPWVGKQVSQAA